MLIWNKCIPEKAPCNHETKLHTFPTNSVLKMSAMLLSEYFKLSDVIIFGYLKVK
jgi:hypothetical protein